MMIILLVVCLIVLGGIAGLLLYLLYLFVKSFQKLESLIYSNKDKLLKNIDANIYWDDIVEIDSSQLSNLNSISLSFLTPTRIKYKERLVKELQFHALKGLSSESC